MLTILSASSGYDTKEGKIIMEFLKTKLAGEIDFEEEEKLFKKIKSNQIADFFRESAVYFNKKATVPQKKDFLLFCLELAQADGETSPEENKIINSLAKSWKIDLQTLLE